MCKSTSATTGTTVPDPTLLQTFFRHPLIVVAPWIVFPYLLYVGYHITCLQHPELVTSATLGIYSPRPAVQLSDARQVLIVGSPGSGTAQMASSLRSALGLEVGHETSDASWHYVRDGTASWFHSIRFVGGGFRDGNGNGNAARLAESLVAICGSGVTSMGFHPRKYGHGGTSGCSYRVPHDDCWRRECYRTLLAEWGCEYNDYPRNSNSNSSATMEQEQEQEQKQKQEQPAGRCLIPFARTLHQVRNPMRTIESLVAKFCVFPAAAAESTSKSKSKSNSVSPEFLTYASALFPHRFFSEYSCVEAAGYFLVDLSNALIDARRHRRPGRKKDDNGSGSGENDASPTIHGFYRVEDTTPCDVAKMAGLSNAKTTVYGPNRERIRRLCEEGDPNDPSSSSSSSSSGGAEAREVVPQKANAINRGRIELGWSDLHGGIYGSTRLEGDRTLELAVRELFDEFGYDPEEESEVGNLRWTMTTTTAEGYGDDESDVVKVGDADAFVNAAPSFGGGGSSNRETESGDSEL